MSRWIPRRAVAAVGAAAVLLVGAVGVYAYGQEYNLHRGFASVVQLPRAGTGRLLDIHFRSPALRRRADYMVYLPPGYTPAKRYPVYYLLHGMPGQPHVFVTIANLDVRLDNLLSVGGARPMILVFPDGRIGGDVYSDSEWANTPSGDYESYVLNVMHDVDARFSTLPDRADRVIGGFSAGAYGAINIALHHLSDFASVQVWSGYFTQTRSGVFAHASRATLAHDSPYDYVTRVAGTIRRDGLRVSMLVGRDDESSAQLLPMAARLRAAGAEVTDAIYPGGHDCLAAVATFGGFLAFQSALHRTDAVTDRRPHCRVRAAAGLRRVLRARAQPPLLAGSDRARARHRAVAGGSAARRWRRAHVDLAGGRRRVAADGAGPALPLAGLALALRAEIDDFVIAEAAELDHLRTALAGAAWTVAA